MSEEFVLFRKFTDLTNAENLAESLNESGIEFELIDNSPNVDLTFTGGNLQEEYLLRLKRSDFDKAQGILDQQAKDLLSRVPKNHYLHEFTDEELTEIIQKQDEWSTLDYQLAQKLLAERGVELSESDLERYKELRQQELSKPDKGNTGWITLAYILAILGGLLGVMIGYAFWTTKRTLPNGDKIHAYDKSTRRHGRTIFLIGAVVLTIAFVVTMTL